MLTRVLEQPLRLSQQAMVVSAKTMQGVDALRHEMLEAAFDKTAFPSFGAVQPGTYATIVRELKEAHTHESSVTWEQMQHTVSQRPDIGEAFAVALVHSRLSSDEDEVGGGAAGGLSTIGSLMCQRDAKAEFVKGRVELASDGTLTAPGVSVSLTRAGASVGHPKKARKGRPFCFVVRTSEQKFVFDAGSSEELARWLSAARPFTAAEQSPAHKAVRQYTFAVSLCGRPVAEFTMRHRSAKAVHQELYQHGQNWARSTFPDWTTDIARDMVHDEANVARRGAELLVYFQLLFTRRDLLALPQFAENMGFGLDTLTERCCRVPDLCAKDPQLLRRAMAYLRATGEVLYHDLATAAAVRERVFLEPQRLIDLMKEFVHHDLAAQLPRRPARPRRQVDAVSRARAI